MEHKSNYKIYNIVTSICVDTDDLGRSVDYPMLGTHVDKKRIIYWRCVYVFCMTSLRVNKNKDHIVYTNDFKEIIIAGINIKDKLMEQGVKIITLPFGKFDPKHHSERFRNAFYKLEVINALAKLNQPSILLDSDCLWTKRDQNLDNILISGTHVLLQDTYQREKYPHKRFPHNLSMEDMGTLYNKIPLNQLDNQYPIWYGGEIVGGSPKHFHKIGKSLLSTIEYCKKQHDLGNKLIFPNGDSIFSNDEYISSYSYNSLKLEIFDTYGYFSKRMWTTASNNNIKDSDRNITIWHLTAEKNTGIKSLFYGILNENSDFWSTTEEKLPEYFGSIVGVPRRKFLISPLMIKMVRKFVPSRLRPYLSSFLTVLNR